MYREYLAEIKDKMAALGIKTAWHSFKNIPADHCYGTYFVPQMRFDGSDERAEYYDYSVQAALFFKDFYDPVNDGETEEVFEESLREYPKFTKTSGYDAEHDQFYTLYNFEFKEFFET